MRRFITYILLIMSFGFFGQETTIECYAPSFKNQVASLVTYTDYISYNFKILDKQLISEDGHVTFHCDPEKGMKAMIQIQDKSGTIYLDPATPKYKVSFPKIIENVQKLTGNTVRLVFEDLPKNDLNTLILEFNLRLDYFLYGDTLKVQRLMRQDQEFRDSLTVFTQNTFAIYKDVDNQYFKDFFKFSIASVALFSDRQEPAKNKYIIFETFIKNSAIRYNNDAYMLFIKDFYKDALSDITLLDRDKVTFAINNKGSREQLDIVMGSQYYLKNEAFRELIMINALQEGFNTNYFNRGNIQTILEIIINEPVVKEHSMIARRVLRSQNKLLPGAEAPLFSWKEKDGTEVNLRELRGKFVYVQFWASWNKPSLQDMIIIRQLKEKYDKYITFVSISLDASNEDYEKFMSANGTSNNWHFGYYNGDSKLLDDYDLRNVPIYFLIDDQGFIDQAPAYAPSPNGIYKSIDETFFYIKKKYEPKAEFNTGRW